jgi:hypothetical protein
LGYSSPADLVNLYPQFYWNSVAPHVQTAIRYLNVTSSGRQWIANLYTMYSALNVMFVYQARRNSGKPC